MQINPFKIRKKIDLKYCLSIWKIRNILSVRKSIITVNLLLADGASCSLLHANTWVNADIPTEKDGG